MSSCGGTTAAIADATTRHDTKAKRSKATNERTGTKRTKRRKRAASGRLGTTPKTPHARCTIRGTQHPMLDTYHGRVAATTVHDKADTRRETGRSTKEERRNEARGRYDAQEPGTMEIRVELRSPRDEREANRPRAKATRTRAQ